MSKPSNNKEELIKKLRSTPIVQIACKQVGVSRATYYRWRKKDQKFLKATDKALAEGISLMNDMAESQLLKAIRENNMTAIIYWLNHRHKAYSNRIEVTAKHEVIHKLTVEQKESVKKALMLASLTINKKIDDKRK